MILFLMLFSQYTFGMNKIQYEQFNWLIKETEHFEIYYYRSEKVLVPFAEDVLEKAYSQLKERLRYRERKDEVKIPVIIYESHPDFESTNVIMERIPESVGGFTEIFKKRIVLPFNGSYSDFRHVLHHELVHVFQYRILYGRGMAALSRAATLRIPLWFMEGMAEYESSGWDESAESYMRDAVLNDRLFTIQELSRIGGYPVYKEGQSILKFIAERYGEQKIGELLNKIKVTQSLTGAVNQVLGIDMKRLNDEWIKSLKKEYWPLIEDKDFAENLFKPIVTHEGLDNIYNYSPSISNSGDKVIYYTDRAGITQLRMVSTITGEDLGLIIKGGRSRMFESLHLMDGHLDFSPDDRYVAFPAKSGGKDILYIYDMEERKISRRGIFEMDRLIWPEWSPDGSKIAFSGLKNGASDIYVYNLKDSSLTNLTHDKYSDIQPNWKSDSCIVFVSDRPVFQEWDYSKERAFIIDLKGNILNSFEFGSKIINPQYYKNNLYFISYRGGNKNLYRQVSDSGTVQQLTDLVGSVQSFSISPDGKAAIGIYYNIGWDIHVINSISKLPGKEPNPPTDKFTTEYIAVSTEDEVKEKEAPLNFGIDYVTSTIGYYSDYGLFGYVNLGMSDMLGNHRLYALFNNTDLSRSDFFLQYYYLKQPIDYGVHLTKQSGYSYYGNRVVRGEIWNPGAEVMYPLDKFHRCELALNFYKLGEDLYQWTDSGYVQSATEVSYGNFLTLSFIRDNTIWGYTAPIRGFRGRIFLEKNILSGDRFWDVENFGLDFRKYWYITDNWIIASRLYLWHSWGDDKYKFSTLGLGGGRSIRGYDYNTEIGTTAGFINLEFRVPIIRSLELGFPPINFGRINGALFADIGGATYDPDEFEFIEMHKSWPRLVDPKMSFGIEFRLDLGITMANFNISKRTDLYEIKEGTFYDFYLGYPF